MLRGLVWVALAGCTPEYGLGAIDGDAAAPADRPRPAKKVVPVHAPVQRPVHELEVALGGGATSAVADYLFVVDGSASMERVLDRVRDGFVALAGSDVFPADARIGVMSTLPADPASRARVHPGAVHAPWLKHEPGFGGLVDRERIAVFRDLAPPQVADRFGLEGCDAWFRPEDRNADGLPCLVANTQISLYPVIVEAGLTALGQRLDRGEPLFRTGAAVNVVFVSDTHDPGIPESSPRFAALEALRPTFEALEQTALARQDLASFRIHAIAPESLCSSEDWSASGPVYFEAAEASGGETLDLCTADPEAYVGLVRRIAVEGAVPQRPVIPVAEGAEVSEILVDGRPSVFTMSRDGRAVVLPGSLPAEQKKVQVRYRLAPERMPDNRTPARDTRKK